MYSVSDIIDLTRYPIDRLDSAEATELVTSSLDALERSALCRFPGFIRPAALERIVREESGLEDVAYPYVASRSAYFFGAWLTITTRAPGSTLTPFSI